MSMDAQKCSDPVYISPMCKISTRGAQGTIAVGNDPFLKAEAYYVDAHFYKT